MSHKLFIKIKLMEYINIPVDIKEQLNFVNKMDAELFIKELYNIKD